jgi:hypothetical protein
MLLEDRVAVIHGAGPMTSATVNLSCGALVDN